MTDDLNLKMKIFNIVWGSLIFFLKLREKYATLKAYEIYRRFVMRIAFGGEILEDFCASTQYPFFKIYILKSTPKSKTKFKVFPQINFLFLVVMYMMTPTFCDIIYIWPQEVNCR